MSCTNCKIDYQLSGRWTGDGYAIFTDLVTRFGKERVGAAMINVDSERKAQQEAR